MLHKTQETQAQSQRLIQMEGEITELKHKLRTAEEVYNKLSESNKQLISK